MSLDFRITNHGSLYLLAPLSEEAVEWVVNNLPADAQTLGRSTAIEPRYVSDIVDGIRRDGLSVN